MVNMIREKEENKQKLLLNNNELGQFTRNYTQTTKRGRTDQQIKAEYQAPGKCEIFSLFCCPGFPKGLAPWSHDFACKV